MKDFHPETRSTNSFVENYFANLKKDVTKGHRMRVGDFIKKQYVRIKGQIAEVKTRRPEYATRDHGKRTRPVLKEKWHKDVPTNPSHKVPNIFPHQTAYLIP